MKLLTFSMLLLCGVPLVAAADIWKWIDMDGETHYVDSDTPIYTWRDAGGEIAFSDRPEHPDATPVILVWHSPGTLADSGSDPGSTDGDSGALPGESEEDRREREQAEAYYCKQAKEIYATYSDAPSLFRTDENGERYYLTDEEVAATMAETESRIAELCR